MKNTDILSKIIKEESYIIDSGEDNIQKGKRKEEDILQEGASSTSITGQRYEQGFEGWRPSAKPEGWRCFSKE